MEVLVYILRDVFLHLLVTIRAQPCLQAMLACYQVQPSQWLKLTFAPSTTETSLWAASLFAE